MTRDEAAAWVRAMDAQRAADGYGPRTVLVDRAFAELGLPSVLVTPPLTRGAYALSLAKGYEPAFSAPAPVSERTSSSS